VTKKSKGWIGEKKTFEGKELGMQTFQYHGKELQSGLLKDYKKGSR